TCVLTPESEEGPYYIHEPLIRNDVRDGMSGVPLTLDIGVMDVTTCTVIENAMVDISAMFVNFSSVQCALSLTHWGGGGMSGSVATDQQTFGRGAYPTDAEGLVEFTTVFPGFYSGRTVHIHTVVLLDYLTNANGTVGVEAGHIQHIGQMFFDEAWTADVMTAAPYNTETITRTTNAEDHVYAVENTAGYNATAQLAKLGNDISDGLLGYITLGINPAASYELNSVSYYTGNSTN
ncbi:aromatic compound dioxygenase, partial [Athelia psychrophila]